MLRSRRVLKGESVAGGGAVDSPSARLSRSYLAFGEGRLRAPPWWPTLLVAAAAVALVGAVVLMSASTAGSPFVIHLTQLLLAGAAAYLLDDPARAVTTTATRSLWRRRAPTFVNGGLTLGAAWATILAVVASRGSPWPLMVVSEELVGLILLALAAAALLQSRGDAEPGVLVSSAVLLLGLSVLIAQETTRTTIYVSDASNLPRQVGWVTFAVLSTVVLCLASRDPVRH
jgi:hypothetical protein